MTSTKRKIAIVIFSLTFIACVILGISAFPGNDVALAESQFGFTAENFKVQGASVRKVDENYGAGIKFHVTMDKSVYDGLPAGWVSGVKILPAEELNEGETIAAAQSENIIDKITTEDWFESADYKNCMESVAYWYGIDAEGYNFGEDLAVAGYVTAGGVTEYTPQTIISPAYVAKEAVTRGDGGSGLSDYYTFTLNYYNASGTLTDSEPVEYGDKLTQPQQPAGETEADIFYGWTNEDMTKKWNFDTDVVKGDVSLYATFRRTPSLYFGSATNFVTTPEGGTLNCYEGEGVTLPQVTADDGFGNDISTSVVRGELPEGLVENGGTYSAASEGQYKIEYKISDPVMATLTVTKTITINVCRDLFGWTDKNFHLAEGKTYVPSDEQVLYVGVNGMQRMEFNLEPSTLYYAEATFNITAPSNSVSVGLAHFAYPVTESSQNKEINKDRWLASIVDRGDKNSKVIDFDTTETNGWATDVSKREVLVEWGLENYRGLPDNNDGQVKYTVVRSGDYFYTFINDSYVNCVTYSYYRDNATTPGIFVIGLDRDSTITNIKYASGNEAQSKLSELFAITRNQKFVSYIPWADSSMRDEYDNIYNEADHTWSQFNVTEDQNKFDINYIATDKDYAYGRLTNYLYYDGDFTFEWTYKPTSEILTNSMMKLEVRSPSAENGAKLFDFGTMFGTGSSNAPTYKTENLDASQGIRYTLKRVLSVDKATYTLTAASIANPEQTQTFTREVSSSNDARWDGAVLLVFANQYIAGQYTDISWSFDS